jgi:hypothetical protein
MSKHQNISMAGDKFQTKSALHEHVRQMVMLERFCSRFHSVAKQLLVRHGDRDTLRVEDEYDVQDLMHALLLLEHDNIHTEEWTPNYSEGGSRKDFILKGEQVVIQAKMARDGHEAKELEQQMIMDIQKFTKQPDCKTLVCFVYDPKGRIANPRKVENDLSGERDGLTVRLIIAPKES